MTVDWRDVDQELQDELDRIMWVEPDEVRDSRLGIFPSGAGTDGKYLSNLFFQVADTQAMSWWTATPAMKSALEDEELSLDACKKFWRYMVLHMAHLMGDEAPPNCPAPWMNLARLTHLCERISESFESIATKEEMAQLMWSWFAYSDRLNKWFSLVFPWELSEGYRRRPA